MSALFKRIGIGIGIFLLIMSCTKDMSQTIIEVAPEEIGATQKITTNVDEVVLVNSEQAINVAEVFFSKFADKGAIKSRSGKLSTDVSKTSDVSIEAVMDNDTPLMYIMNYPEGGFAIVSATRNYYPVLAYSEKNKFVLNPEMEALWSWVEATKESIKASDDLDDSTKMGIRNSWLSFGSVFAHSFPEISPVTYGYSTPLEAYNARMSELATLWNGWVIYTLPSASYHLTTPTMNYINTIRGYYGGDPNYSIVGIRNAGTIDPNIGPILSTAWSQYWNPTGTTCKAGCATVAMAQIMMHHQHPTSYNWYNIKYMTGSALLDLYHDIGMALGVNYTTCNVGANASKIQNAFQSFGYTASTASHSFATVKNNLLLNRPVLMGGDTGVSGSGHAWVCAGVRTIISQNNYFVEFLTQDYFVGEYSYDCYLGSPSSPCNDIIAEYQYCYMNWGEGAASGDGWFLDSNPNGPDGLYNKNRVNVYVYP